MVMVKAPRGYRNRTRNMLRKHIRDKGHVPRLSKVLYPYKVGDRVVVKIDPSFHGGMPHKRFHGLTGSIIGKRGSAYIVKLSLGNKEKTIITYPVHLAPFKQ